MASVTIMENIKKIPDRSIRDINEIVAIILFIHKYKNENEIKRTYKLSDELYNYLKTIELCQMVHIFNLLEKSCYCIGTKDLRDAGFPDVFINFLYPAYIAKL